MGSFWKICFSYTQDAARMNIGEGEICPMVVRKCYWLKWKMKQYVWDSFDDVDGYFYLLFVSLMKWMAFSYMLALRWGHTQLSVEGAPLLEQLTTIMGQARRQFVYIHGFKRIDRPNGNCGRRETLQRARHMWSLPWHSNRVNNSSAHSNCKMVSNFYHYPIICIDKTMAMWNSLCKWRHRIAPNVYIPTHQQREVIRRDQTRCRNISIFLVPNKILLENPRKLSTLIWRH